MCATVAINRAVFAEIYPIDTLLIGLKYFVALFCEQYYLKEVFQATVRPVVKLDTQKPSKWTKSLMKVIH